MAERLRLLAQAGACNEIQLAAYAGNLEKFSHFNTLISACDDETAQNYKNIALICKKNEDINKEIEEYRKFLKLKDYDKGLYYAQKTVERYPFRAKAWEFFMEAKCLKDENNSPFEDLKRFNACLDAEINITDGKINTYYNAPQNISPVIAERCKKITDKKKALTNFSYKNILKPIVLLLFILLMFVVWNFIGKLFS